MSNLEELVPPLELCKKIPEGKLGFTCAHWAFVWAEDNCKLDGEQVIGWWQLLTEKLYIFSSKRPTDEQRQELIHKWVGGNENAVAICQKIYPAPTLQEIMSELPDRTSIEFRDSYPQFVMFTPELDETPASHNGAEAALRLWLEVNKTYKTDKTDKTNKTNETEGTEK